MKLYQQLADHFSSLIRAGTLKPGERMPSVRATARERGISAATVIHAYELLEGGGLIETRPRSGFYVGAAQPAAPAPPRSSRPPTRSTHLDVSELVFEVLESLGDRSVVPFGSAFPDPTLFPLARLGALAGTAARTIDPWSTVQDLPAGSAELRRQIARRYQRSGAIVSPDEIIITSGALEALNLSLQALTRPGDVVAIESPAFYGCLQAVEALGLKAVEVPTHPVHGVELAELARVLDQHPVRVCWFMTNFQNPLGALMPDDSRRELVALLRARDIPLIEDDVYAELYFGERRPRAIKAFDTSGLVLSCGSFSKSLSPGYRIGWVAAGKFVRALGRRKLMSSLGSNIPAQNALALFLRGGGYDRYLGKLRRALQAGQQQLVRALQMHLSPGFRITQPAGGYFLWLEFSREVSAIDLHRRALEHGFSIAPGPMFSARRRFGSCLRLNYGHPWSAQSERAIRALGLLSRRRST
ncbi:MAG: PLP-dependent aminotransferase family protein [Sinobacteraceae bacterium]|nr:PLP-dependent aminotransferase family protein [Nevskiaceae bacterium]